MSPHVGQAAPAVFAVLPPIGEVVVDSLGAEDFVVTPLWGRSQPEIPVGAFGGFFFGQITGDRRVAHADADCFALVSGKKGNTDPQDLVTDGTSIWVVDGSQLKVFKYTLSGSALGSWTNDPANAHPTGITINPSNVSDIWIVDSGTLKVYQYTGAASRTSGSQNAAATFALVPGDTNPQGIADPPPADMLLAQAPTDSAPALSALAVTAAPQSATNPAANPLIQSVALQAQHLTDLVMTLNARDGAGFQAAVNAVPMDWSLARLNPALAMDAPATAEFWKTAESRSITLPWWTNDSAAAGRGAGAVVAGAGARPAERSTRRPDRG
jgi:hypothetical protein